MKGIIIDHSPAMSQNQIFFSINIITITSHMVEHLAFSPIPELGTYVNNLNYYNHMKTDSKEKQKDSVSFLNVMIFSLVF